RGCWVGGLGWSVAPVHCWKPAPTRRAAAALVADCRTNGTRRPPPLWPRDKPPLRRLWPPPDVSAHHACQTGTRQHRLVSINLPGPVTIGAGSVSLTLPGRSGPLGPC